MNFINKIAPLYNNTGFVVLGDSLEIYSNDGFLTKLITSQECPDLAVLAESGFLSDISLNQDFILVLARDKLVKFSSQGEYIKTIDLLSVDIPYGVTRFEPYNWPKGVHLLENGSYYLTGAQGSFILKFDSFDSLDTSFASGSAPYLPDGYGGYLLIPEAGGSVSDLYISKDGSITFIGGHTGDGLGYYVGQASADGSLSYSFGPDNGSGSSARFITPHNAESTFAKILKTETGSYLAAYQTGEIYQFDVEGSIDTDFGQSGKFTIPLTNDQSFEAEVFQLVEILTLDDGNTLIVGNQVFRKQGEPDWDSNILIAKVDQSGKLAEDFGEGGIKYFGSVSYDNKTLATSAALGLAGNIVVAGVNWGHTNGDPYDNSTYYSEGFSFSLDRNGLIDESFQIGTANSDYLRGTEGNDIASAGAGNDILSGYEGDDDLRGGEDNDSLIGGAGNDSLNGGDGTDTANYSSVSAAITVNLSTATPTATGDGTDTLTSIENVSTGSGADILTGNTANNTLDGGANNDSLNGGAGNDSLIGGLGNDSLIGGAGNDSLNGGDGTDTANYSSVSAAITVNLSTATPTATGDGTDTLTSIENVSTGSGADILTGNTANNTLDGGANNDSLNGGAGNDSLIGGLGNDSLIGGLGNDSLIGGAGNDSLNGGDGTDTANYSSVSAAITVNLSTATPTATGDGTDTLTSIENVSTGSGADILTGNTANNTLDGGANNDSLNGGAGNDSLIGGLGNDSLNGGDGTDTANYSSVSAAITVNLSTATPTATGDGTDTLTSIENISTGSGADILTGNTANNTLDGGANNDSLNGGAGNDSLIGGAGNDTINGGIGNDALTGGLGADVFRFDSVLNASTNVDRITDFTTGQNDRIQLENTGTGLFTAITTAGTLTATAFRIGTSFSSTSQRIRYDSGTGNLFYDADGSGTTSASILFATLSPGLALTNTQFVVT